MSNFPLNSLLCCACLAGVAFDLDRDLRVITGLCLLSLLKELHFPLLHESPNAAILAGLYFEIFLAFDSRDELTD
jgi:hypothetical protein